MPRLSSVPPTARSVPHRHLHSQNAAPFAHAAEGARCKTVHRPKLWPVRSINPPWFIAQFYHGHSWMHRLFAVFKKAQVTP